MEIKVHEDQRTALITGLRELADWYEQHPDVPLPAYPSFSHCVLTDDDLVGVAEVEALAAALGADVTRQIHIRTVRMFGSVEFSAAHVLSAVAEEYDRRAAAGEAAVPRVAHVEALAALEQARAEASAELVGSDR